jgi:hypothetical protein
MPLSIGGKLTLSVRRLVTRIAHAIHKRDHGAAINVADPLGGALGDADLLVAFAAQGRRNIKPDKVKALILAKADIEQARASSQRVTSAQLASFWIAYDDFAVDMTPLSAHSIRSSMAVNEKRFPASLLTPTAYNAALAVVVFFVCLALQGFWVAGKELIDRADSLERQKVELQRRIESNSGVLRRAENRESISRGKLCGVIQCDPDETLVDRQEKRRPDNQQKPDLDGLAVMKAELNLVRTEVAEKSMVDRELSQELTGLNDRSRPLEELLRKWHERARLVCDAWYLKFLCPVDNPKVGTVESSDLKDRLGQSRAQAEELNAEYERRKPERSVLTSLSERVKVLAKQAEVRRLEQEMAARDADRFRSIVVEVRIIVANMGTYLIAMVMGLLGSLTFILRSLSQQLREHTYVPVSASISIVRICLGAIAGVFGTLLVPVGENTLKSLPPLFIPFVFGYGIEILFSLLDKMVRSFTQTDAVPGPAGQRAA